MVKGIGSEPDCLGSNPRTILDSCKTLNNFPKVPVPRLPHVFPEGCAEKKHPRLQVSSAGPATQRRSVLVSLVLSPPLLEHSLAQPLLPG